ncbi:UDP-glucose 4-epimerase GalE [Candidatus Roizmanbacteria bacterium CG10_big_fil_rev_8_21_14_0_10_45_7]|uniref:UDP-glucose 4-epimerase n=1 Tax=Candidatus Roizmanbacteria bacterium CG10_big_fil_rev_8_21_14_0_10_45_7 TaxID=1974854 RepID=A0A2M8KUB6_9BACT|nr:MAG: UDP-glucose 4-epimerase GalE [Candidatus Roizmanbacteria bacterium CG10_big_fil_rev_8_21_14_0_10_45_7]
MNTILVTGAGGYIGSVGTYELLKKGYKVIALDNFSRGYHEPLELLQKKFGNDHLTIYERSLHDKLDDLFQKEHPEAVVHYAAFCKVDESMKEPDIYFDNNTMGSLNLLRTMERNQVRTIIFSSTCAVYGEAQYVPVDEKHPTNPTNPYGDSKRMTEKIIDWYKQLRGWNYSILRYFNVCGASEDGLIGDSKKPSVLLVQNAVRGALGIEPFHITCPKVDTPDGTPIRDYINVVDLNEAHIAALEYMLKGNKSEIMNLGTGKGNSVKEIVSEVQKVTGKPFSMDSTTPRQGEYASMIANTEKAQKVLGWKPKRSIADSVAALTAWYSKHPHGWSR